MRKLLSLLALVWVLPAFAQFSISQLPPATTPLTGAELFPCTQLGATKKCLTASVVGAANASFLLQSPNAGLPLSRTLVGTANEILLADGGALGNLVLSTPQPIATTSDVTFHSLLLTVDLTVPNGGTGVSTLTGLVLGNGSSAMTAYAGTSCTNQFVRSLGGSGVAACNSVANTDLVNSSITLNGAAIALGGTRTLSLASADFVNQGTTTTVLHGNAAGNPSFGSVSLTTDVSNVLPSANGGTSFGTYTLGDILYSSATNTLAKLPGNTTATKNFLTQTGTGAVSAAPAWGTIAAADLPGTFSGFANPSGLIGLTAVNGVATTATRSDATHALDQSISPTWTGTHTFNNIVTAAGTNVTGATIPANGSYLSAANNPCLSSNTAQRLCIGSAGAISANAPTAGDTLTLAGLSGGRALFANYPAGTGASNVLMQTQVSTGNASVWRLTQSGVANFDISAAATTNVVSLINGGVTSQTISTAGAVGLPALASSSAPTTGTVCWTTATGNLTVDTTLACLSSTIKVKQNVRPLDSGLGEVMRLFPVSYELRPEFDAFHSGRQIGLIAEDVAELDPRLVAFDDNGDPRGVRYMQMTALLVKSIQQQQLEIYALWLALAGSFAFTYFRTRGARA